MFSIKRIYSISLLVVALFTLSSCEEFISKNFDTDTIKKLRIENTNLKIQIDKLQRQIKKDKEENISKDVMISLYDLRHAVEKFALDSKGNYPEAENLNDLIKIVKPSLPENFSLESNYIETIKSTEKGYIFIVTVNSKKIVVSNLI